MRQIKHKKTLNLLLLAASLVVCEVIIANDNLNTQLQDLVHQQRLENAVETLSVGIRLPWEKKSRYYLSGHATNEASQIDHPLMLQEMIEFVSNEENLSEQLENYNIASTQALVRDQSAQGTSSTALWIPDTKVAITIASNENKLDTQALSEQVYETIIHSAEWRRHQKYKQLKELGKKKSSVTS